MAATPPPTARRTLTGTEAKFWPSLLVVVAGVVGAVEVTEVVMTAGTLTVTEVMMGTTVVEVSVAVAMPVDVTAVVLDLPEEVCLAADATATRARATENFMIGVESWL